MLETPVVLLIFNRPDTTTQVFDAIRKAKPAQLLIVADGPRPEHPKDVDKVAATRAIVEDIDWPCDVMRNYSDVNLGCGKRVSSGLDWVFQNVSEAIILEDDCVPNKDFFTFCSMMLERYRDDERIMQVAGTNYASDIAKPRETYFFSKYYAIWGWATWRRAWLMYDFQLHNWPEYRREGRLKWLCRNRLIAEFYEHRFDSVCNGQIDTWDIQWDFACLFNSGLAVVPRSNLVTNVGDVGTFSNGKGGVYHSILFKQSSSLDLSAIVHPKYIHQNWSIDQHIFRLMAPPLSARYRIRRLLCSLLR